MNKKIHPWEKGESLFPYVKKNIDVEGFYCGKDLPDRIISSSDPNFSLELGTTDAYLSMSSDIDNEKMQDEVYIKIMAFCENPSVENEVQLYRTVCRCQCISYCETLIDRLAQEELPLKLVHLAENWLYNAPQREAVKFAIIICGIFNLDTMSRSYELDVKKDLMLLALCEEFTFYVIFALDMSNITTGDDLWEIISHTRGWGKIHAMEAFTYDTIPKRDWLLSYGSDISVAYPGIALLGIQEGHMLDFLQRPHLSPELYRGILKTINNYVLFLIDYDSENENDPELPFCDTYTLVKECLRHSAEYNETLEDVILLTNLSQELKALAANENWQAISANNCHLLISATEKLIFHKDWLPEINSKLVNADGSVNYLAISFSFAVKVDIRSKLMHLLKENPLRTELYSFLLLTRDQKKFNTVLNFARKHINIYQNGEHTLDSLLLALSRKNGLGTEFVIAGLTSIYDRPRSYALNVLEGWDEEYITPEIKAALVRAKAMSQHPFLPLRIDALLKKDNLDLSGFISTLNNM
jgi:hypothetical protein